MLHSGRNETSGHAASPTSPQHLRSLHWAAPCQGHRTRASGRCASNGVTSTTSGTTTSAGGRASANSRCRAPPSSTPALTCPGPAAAAAAAVRGVLMPPLPALSVGKGVAAARVAGLAVAMELNAGAALAAGAAAGAGAVAMRANALGGSAGRRPAYRPRRAVSAHSQKGLLQCIMAQHKPVNMLTRQVLPLTVYFCTAIATTHKPPDFYMPIPQRRVDKEPRSTAHGAPGAPARP